MRDEIILHNYKNQLNSLVEKVKHEPDLLDTNRYHILEFHDYCFSIGLTQSRICKYLRILINLSKMLKNDFKRTGRKDIQIVVQEIERSGLGEWTKHDYKVTLKRFYKWMNGDEYYPEQVRWIKTTMKNGKHKLPNELLTEEEVKSMINTTQSTRDKAFVSTLYESGCRIAEILSLRLRDVQFDKYGASFMVSGKTGMRRVRLVMASPYLLEWINNHPEKDDLKSPLWIVRKIKSDIKTTSYEHLKHGSASILLKRLAEKSGIKKNVYPHLFRHSRATHLAKHLTEAQMKEIFGWTQSSDMAAIYVHLSGRDVDDALLKLSGLKKEEHKEESTLQAKPCPRCKLINSPTAKFCNRCSSALDIQAAMELDNKRKAWDANMSILVKDPDVQQLLIKKMIEMGIDGTM